MSEIDDNKQNLPGYLDKKDPIAKLLLAATYSGFFALVGGFLAFPFTGLVKKISNSEFMNVNDPYTLALGGAWIASFLTFLAFWFLPNDMKHK